MDTIEVDRATLVDLHRNLKALTTVVEAMVAGIKCVHENEYEITTMGGAKVRRFLCPDCGESRKEDFPDELGNGNI